MQIKAIFHKGNSINNFDANLVYEEKVQTPNDAVHLFGAGQVDPLKFTLGHCGWVTLLFLCSLFPFLNEFTPEMSQQIEKEILNNIKAVILGNMQGRY